MTTLEMSVLLAEALALGFSFLPFSTAVKGVALARAAIYLLGALLALLHLAVAGYRWQMIPAYLLAALLLTSLRGAPLPPLSQAAGLVPAGGRIYADQSAPRLFSA